MSFDFDNCKSNKQFRSNRILNGNPDKIKIFQLTFINLNLNPKHLKKSQVMMIYECWDFTHPS